MGGDGVAVGPLEVVPEVEGIDHAVVADGVVLDHLIGQLAVQGVGEQAGHGVADDLGGVAVITQVHIQGRDVAFIGKSEHLGLPGGGGAGAAAASAGSAASASAANQSGQRQRCGQGQR